MAVQVEEKKQIMLLRTVNTRKMQYETDCRNFRSSSAFKMEKIGLDLAKPSQNNEDSVMCFCLA